MEPKLIVVAPDSFKGSLTSSQYCAIASRTLGKLPGIAVRCFPMADGGEGTAEVICHVTGVKPKKYSTVGADDSDIFVDVPLLPDGSAVVESALVVGLNMPSTQSAALSGRSTYGLGKLINQLHSSGVSSVQIGLGGTGTNDGGFGLLHALGCQFIGPGGSRLTSFNSLNKLESINIDACRQKFSSLKLRVLSDVNNPLLGRLGATRVFGPQKGLGDDFDYFENLIGKMARCMAQALGKDYSVEPGAGAAGGLGFALKCLGSDMVSGADFLIDLYNLDNVMSDATLVITGEGRSDEQTACGKLPARIAEMAIKHGTPCLLVSGAIELNALESLEKLFCGCLSIAHGPCSLEESIRNGEKLLEATLGSAVRLFLNGFESRTKH